MTPSPTQNNEFILRLFMGTIALPRYMVTKKAYNFQRLAMFEYRKMFDELYFRNFMKCPPDHAHFIHYITPKIYGYKPVVEFAYNWGNRRKNRAHFFPVPVTQHDRRGMYYLRPLWKETA